MKNHYRQMDLESKEIQLFIKIQKVQTALEGIEKSFGKGAVLTGKALNKPAAKSRPDREESLS